MAFAKERRENGVTTGRWTAVYLDLDGKERSAGTFDSEEQATDVATKQERYLRRGVEGVSPKEKATKTLDDFFEPWLASHQVELSTKKGYRDVWRCYLSTPLGKQRVAEVEREAIRALLHRLRDQGLSPATQKGVRSVISAVMTTAVEDGYRTDHPVRGLRVEKKMRGTRKITVLSVDQYKSLNAQLGPGGRVLSRVIIATGCRPSEAFALTVNDVDRAKRRIAFNKAVKVLSKHEAKDGIAGWYIGSTKDHDTRILPVDSGVIKLLDQWITENGLEGDDLIFPREVVFPRRRATSVRREQIDLTPELIATLGTHAAPNGREYQHGTWQCYVTAKCRGCAYCRQAFADYRYDLERRKGRAGHARGAVVAEPSKAAFVTTDMWRTRFQEACRAAELPFVPTAYQLRHTHASWLINKGEDPKTVAERMGHTSLDMTAIYVEVVDDGESAADIMDDLGLDDVA